MIKVIKQPCFYKKKITHIIKDTTGSGEDYKDIYYFCTMTGHRLKKRECVKCKRVNK
jgi:hypothetical protein